MKKSTNATLQKKTEQMKMTNISVSKKSIISWKGLLLMGAIMKLTIVTPRTMWKVRRKKTII
jgi:hypothetical protein